MKAYAVKAYVLLRLFLCLSPAICLSPMIHAQEQPPQQEPGLCQLSAEAAGITMEQKDLGSDYACEISAPSRPGEISAEKAVWEVHVSCKSKYDAKRVTNEMIYTLTVDIENDQCGKAHMVMF